MFYCDGGAEKPEVGGMSFRGVMKERWWVVCLCAFLAGRGEGTLQGTCIIF